MSNLSILLCLVVTVISIQIIYGTGTAQVQDAPQFEIRTGNCSKAVASDLVFLKHVHLSRLPFVIRSTNESWYGDQKIYCILAISQKEQEKGSTVAIIKGGLNHTFVTFELKSSVNHGLEYNLSVYGK